MSEMWKRLRQARLAANLSQKQVADHFGIQRPAVSQWEASDSAKRTTPGSDRLREIAKLYRCDSRWLLEGKDAAPAYPPAPDINSPNHLASGVRVGWKDAKMDATSVSAGSQGAPKSDTHTLSLDMDLLTSLLPDASPRSRTALECIVAAYREGRLTEADLELLNQIAERIAARKG